MEERIYSSAVKTTAQRQRVTKKYRQKARRQRDSGEGWGGGGGGGGETERAKFILQRYISTKAERQTDRTRLEGGRERDREFYSSTVQTKAQRQRDRDTDTDRHCDGQIVCERQTDRQTDRQAGREGQRRRVFRGRWGGGGLQVPTD